MHPHWHDELIRAVRARYQRAPRQEKTVLLDEFCVITGYSRKHAIALLNVAPRLRTVARRGRPPSYGLPAVQLLASLWIRAGCPCSARFKAELPRWIVWARQRQDVPARLARQILGMSARTIDRRLRPFREQMASWPEDLRRRIKRGEARSRLPAEQKGHASRETFVLRVRQAPPPGRRPWGAPSLSGARGNDKMSAPTGTTTGRDLMEIKTRREQGATVISVIGAMVRQETAFPVMKEVIKLLPKEQRFVIDLGKVDKIDSAGVGELVAINVAVKEKGGQLRLANLDERVGKVLQMALIHKIIPTFDTQKEALDSFGESPLP